LKRLISIVLVVMLKFSKVLLTVLLWQILAKNH